MKIITRFVSFKAVCVLFVLVFQIFWNATRAQITITVNDMPSPGDTVRKSLTTINPGMDYTISGPNHQWDFSSLFPLGQTVDTFVTVSSVPLWYQLVFIPNLVANLAQKFPELNNFPQLPLTDPYRFYRKATNTFNDVGYAVTVSGIPVPLRLNPPDVIYKLPLAYNNKDSSQASGQISVPGFGYVGVQRKRVNHVDGWGTVTTPYGSFNVLRVKSRVNEVDSIYVDTLGFGQKIERFYTEYKWLANGRKQPVLEVIEEPPLIQVRYIDNILQPPVNISDKIALVTRMVISPNPFHDHAIALIDLSSAASVNITIQNYLGSVSKELYKGFLPAGRHYFPVSAVHDRLPPGIYLFTIETDHDVLSTKFVVY